MEILKQGRLPHKSSKDFRGTCEYCGCGVKCNLRDEIILTYTRSNPIYQVKCPTEGCGGYIHLHEYFIRDCFAVRSGEREAGIAIRKIMGQDPEAV